MRTLNVSCVASPWIARTCGIIMISPCRVCRVEFVFVCGAPRGGVQSNNSQTSQDAFSCEVVRWLRRWPTSEVLRRASTLFSVEYSMASKVGKLNFRRDSLAIRESNTGTLTLLEWPKGQLQKSALASQEPSQSTAFV